MNASFLIEHLESNGVTCIHGGSEVKIPSSNGKKTLVISLIDDEDYDFDSMNHIIAHKLGYPHLVIPYVN